MNRIPIVLVAFSTMHASCVPPEEAEITVISQAVEVPPPPIQNGDTPIHGYNEAAKTLQNWADAYSNITSAADVGLRVLKMLGIIDVKKMEDKFANLQDSLALLISQGTVAEIMTEVDLQRNVLREATNTLLQFERNRLRGNADEATFKPKFRADYDQKTREALAAIALLKSGRPHSKLPDKNGYPWTGVEGEPLRVDSIGNVYDWRIVIPALLEGLAYRITIIAFLDPDFRTSRRNDVEFENLRDALMRHYKLMLRAVRCGTALSGQFAVLGCRDFASGLSDTVPQDSSGFLGASSRVMQGIPLFQVRRLADTLGLYITGHPDISGKPFGIQSRYMTRNCLVQKDNQSNSVVVLEPCSNTNTRQRWSYNRSTGAISNAATGMCLEPLSGGIGETAGGTDPDHPPKLKPPLHPGPRAAVGAVRCEEYRNSDGNLVAINPQSWTYDSWTGEFQNGVGPYYWPISTLPPVGNLELGSALDIQDDSLVEGKRAQINIRQNGKRTQSWGVFDLVGATFPDAALEMGIDRRGMDFRVTSQPSAVACQSACRNSAACRAFTFLQENAGSGSCWLKSAVPPASSDSRRVGGRSVSPPALTSGIVGPGFESNTDRPGPGYLSFAATAVDCRARCQSDGACRSYTWYQSNCQLKSSVPGPVPLMGSIAGFKIANAMF